MLKFEKYHGAGNDFVIVKKEDLENIGISDYEKLARQICDRHYGVGADGLIILAYEDGVPFMMFRNPDGSVAPMCGNGIRTFGHYLKKNNLILQNEFLVKTLAGNMILETFQSESNENEFFVKVNMGKTIFDIKNLINTEKEQFLKERISVGGKEIEISYIFMGTDHSVIFVNDMDEYDIDEIGQKIENYTEIFPKRVNVNFVKVYDEENMEVITWERGAGRTLACGTGVTASAVLARTFGYTKSRVGVKVPGGKLIIEYDKKGEDAYMIGPSERVAEGLYFRNLNEGI